MSGHTPQKRIVIVIFKDVRAAGAALPRLVRASVFGRELIDGGFPRDVDLALEQGSVRLRLS